MQLNLYKEQFISYFNLPVVEENIREAISVIKGSNRIFFIGNGGSNAVCSHMMEDFAKVAGYETFSFSDATLITCLANDYGYERAMEEWLKIYFKKGDLLIAVSSSGESKNILNAADYVLSKQGSVITLTGFDQGNQLRTKGIVNFCIPIKNYGIVECYHQVILHIILDSLNEG